MRSVQHQAPQPSLHGAGLQAVLLDVEWVRHSQARCRHYPSGRQWRWWRQWQWWRQWKWWRRGAALARRNLPRCHSCGCHNCKRTKRACNAPALDLQGWRDAHLGAIPKNLRSSKVNVCVRCKAVCWMAPLPAVVPLEPAVHDDDAAVSAALVSQGTGDEFTSDDDASGQSE